MRVTHFVGLWAVVAACNAPRPQEPVANHVRETTPVSDEACAVPPNWQLYEMALADLTVRPLPVPAEVRVLAWQQTVDARPLYIDSALLWIRTRDGQYLLANLFRHPRDPQDRAWHRYYGSTPSRPPGFAMTSHPPTHDELESFLTDTNWSWGPEDAAFKLIDARVCKRAWEASFREPPWH